MKYFAKINPAMLFIYYASIIIISMFCMNPIMIGISVLGSYIFLVSSEFGVRRSDHLICILIIIIGTAVNMIFSHNGKTVLLVINNSPITLESAIYGFFASLMITAVFVWFRTFSKIMTSDKLLYLFGALSPKLELILSIALRYIPLFSAQAQKIKEAQQTSGMYREDSLRDEMKNVNRVFSVMVTWALENGIVTAESMEARGYGVGRRTSFNLFRIKRSDIIFVTITILLFGVVIASLFFGALEFHYYPLFLLPSISLSQKVAYVSYIILVLMPSFIEKCEELRWKYYRSKI